MNVYQNRSKNSLTVNHDLINFFTFNFITIEKSKKEKPENRRKMRENTHKKEKRNQSDFQMRAKFDWKLKAEKNQSLNLINGQFLDQCFMVEQIRKLMKMVTWRTFLSLCFLMTS